MHRFSNLGRKEQQRLIKEDGRGKEENRTMKNFEGLLEQIKSCSKKKLAVAVAQDDAVLEAVKAAKDKDIADAILVGDADKIKEIAASMDMSLEGFEIIDVKDPTEAALTAVKLVHDGEADMYMKGLIDTKGFLKSVLNTSSGW